MAEPNSTRRNRCFVDLTGKRFGKWTVIGEAKDHPSKSVYWNCRCECGAEKAVKAYSLTNRDSNGCIPCGAKHHGRSKTPEYEVWHSMKQRCSNPLHQSRSDYSERGITVCAEWDSFETFYADMGPRPSPKHTLERKDNDLGYSKDNCKWATWAEQARNKRSNRLITFNGETLCLKDWAAKVGISYITLHGRIRKGWSVESALTTPTSQIIAFRGEEMSIKDWAARVGIDFKSLCSRFKRGWSIERALTEPVKNSNKSKS